MAACSEDFLCGDGVDAVLTILSSYCYGTNASEAVEKTATDENDHHKCSLSVVVCITNTRVEIEKDCLLRTHPA